MLKKAHATNAPTSTPTSPSRMNLGDRGLAAVLERVFISVTSFATGLVRVRRSLSFRQLELLALAQEFDRVLIHHFVHILGAPAAPFHFQRGVGHVQRDAHTPIA